MEESRINIRVSAEIKEQVDAHAEASRMRPTEWARDVIVDAINKRTAEPSQEAFAVALATWIDRRIAAQEAKQKCDVNAVFSFLRVVLEQTMIAEVFARSAATAYPPDEREDAQQLVEAYSRDARTRCTELVQDVNRLVGEARDDGRERAKAAGASLESLTAMLDGAES